MGAKTPKPQSPLAKFVRTIKADSKADRSPAEYLKKIIDDYDRSGEFDKYITTHADYVSKYLTPEKRGRGWWRSSAAGKCLQEQAFNFIEDRNRFERSEPITRRPPEQHRALNNGTFVHIRWHLFFDALHEKGLVRTLWAEELRYDDERILSGTVDRVIEFEFDSETIRAIIDFKSMKANYFDPLLEPQLDHAMQQHAYKFFKYGVGWWIMLYENKNTHVLKIFARQYDDVMIEKLNEQYRKLNNWVSLIDAGAINDQLPPLPLITDWCRYCEWNKACLSLHPKRDGKAGH